MRKFLFFYFFILLIAFQILYMFLPDISVYFELIEYAYMIESFCLISAKFSSCILMIDSYFSHAMKCALSKAPLRYIIFLSDFLLLEILMREMFLIRWSN
jgi:hypothetical protein